MFIGDPCCSKPDTPLRPLSWSQAGRSLPGISRNGDFPEADFWPETTSVSVENPEISKVWCPQVR